MILKAHSKYIFFFFFKCLIQTKSFLNLGLEVQHILMAPISEDENLIPCETGGARVSKQSGAARGLHRDTYSLEEEHHTISDFIRSNASSKKN